VGYAIDKPLLSNIHFRLQSADRMAITGDNGKGKSTLIKAIMGDQSIYKTGEWSVIKQGEIGYLDQHYGTLDEDKTVLEVFSEGVRDWPHHEVRRHLNDFLFSKNEAVMAFVKTLSGGEKVRLNLACIAAKTPKFLIFDEVTNNLDLETREHVIQVLRAYPGGLMVISHDIEFLESIGIHEWVAVENFRVS
jgi:ATPase subunit of ABC transporter with duplicated ATPase domains